MVFAAGQHVRIRANGIVGKVFLKLPSSDVYLVQWPGFPLVEKAYYSSDLEPVTGVEEQRVRSASDHSILDPVSSVKA